MENRVDVLPLLSLVAALYFPALWLCDGTSYGLN